LMCRLASPQTSLGKQRTGCRGVLSPLLANCLFG
jgi:hypothetical protein